MTRAMSHDEASESLAAAALDALPADEQAAVLAHAATCPQCGPELDALRQALATLGNTTPVAATQPTPDVEQRLQRIRVRLLARAQADGAPLIQPKPQRSAAWGWVALAAAIVLAVLLASQKAATARAVMAANEQAALESAALDTVRGRLASRDREIAALTGPTTSVVGLNTTGAAEATALMFWDKTNNSWAFYAHHLPPLPAGKTYQLWLLTPSSKISAGTFTPATDSSVEVHATYALPRDALKGVAVSEEPSGGVPQPTGRIVIIGTPGPK
jgi:hypothetical protein